MTEPIELKKVTVESDILGDLEPSRIEMVIQCGEPSRVNFSINTPNPESPVTLASEGAQLQKLLDKNSEFQTQMFSGDESRATVTISEESIVGGGGSTEITFEGVLASPSFVLSPGTFSSGISAIHEDILMENLVTNIYSEQMVKFGKQSKNNETQFLSNYKKEIMQGSESALKEQDLNKHILALIKSSIESDKLFDVDAENEIEKNDKAYKNRLEMAKEEHNLNVNGEGLTLAKAFLDRSTDTRLQSEIPGPGGAEAIDVFSDAHKCARPDSYCEWMVHQFVSAKNFYSFLINTVCPTFLMEYVCQADGDSKFQHPLTDDSEETDIDIQISRISFNLGSRFQRAIGLVTCQAKARNLIGEAQNDAATLGPDIGFFPSGGRDPANGKVISTSSPSWFDPMYDNNPQVYNKKTRDKNQEGRKPEEAAEANMEAKDDARNGKEQKGVDFLGLWAEKQYRLWALKNTTSTIELPLNLNWGKSDGNPIGKRYKVKAQGGGGENPILFSGYLNRVTHSAAVGQNQGSAITVLDFTHIKTDEFDLPA